MPIFKWLVRWLLQAIALLVVAYVVPGFHVDSFSAALIAVLIIGFLNMTLGLLLKAISMPIGILTLGLFFLVINAVILEFSSRLTPGFHVDGFSAALAGSIVLALVHILFWFVTD